MAVSARSVRTCAISSGASGWWALMAARHATNASSRSSTGELPRPASSSSSCESSSASRGRSSVRRSEGTARRRIAPPPNPSRAKPRRASSGLTRSRARSARRGQLERLREQELLRRERAALEVAAQPLEEHALVRDVLVDEEDLVGRVRHDEGVLDLADHAAEEGLAPVARLALAEERGLRRVAPRPAGRVAASRPGRAPA